MAGLRSMTNNLTLRNNENERVLGKRGIVNAKGGQQAVTGALQAKMGVTRPVRRAAMAEIGNNAAVPNNGVSGILKPARFINKEKPLAQKAAQALPVEKATERATRPRRKCSNEKAAEPMEAEVLEVPDVEPMEIADVGTSTQFLEGVEDIDKEDIEDPQLVVDYVNEIYTYLRWLEQQQAIKENYLKTKPGVLIPKMRTVLVDWLVEVHQQFSLLQETLYMAVAILDRYLQCAAEKVPRKKLQLVGVTAMFIASKYEEMYAPEIGDFVYITDQAYTQGQIRELEMEILRVLNFDLGRPLPLHFLRRNSKAGQVDATVHTLAKYVMELTLLDYSMVHIAPSMLASAALAFSLKVLEKDDTKDLNSIWTSTLHFYSQYSLEEILPTLQALAGAVLKTSVADENGKLLSIRKKYSSRKYARISALPELTGFAVAEMAEGRF